MKLGRLVLRVIVGSLFFAHGAQKLFGWFGGSGIDATAQTMERIGMRPGRRNALAAGAGEAVGGAAIVAGALTPAAAATLIATMLTAIRTVHLQKGFFATNGGYEFNLTLIVALLALTDAGPGPLSVDRALGIEEGGGGWTLAALAAGAAGSAFAVAAGEAAEPDAA